MTRTLAVLPLMSGCILLPCGSVELSDTTATNYEGEGYDGHWHETCSATGGTTASWNLYEDGYATLAFGVDAPGGRGWQGIDVGISAAFPNALLVPGTSVTAPDLVGGANINPCIDCPMDEVGLTEGTIEVLSGFEGDDPCTETEGPTFRIAWDSVFGGDGSPTYELHGKDAVLFSTFLSPECSSSTGY